MQEPLEHVNIEAAGEGQHLPDLLGAGAALQMPMPPAALSGHDELVEAPTFARRLRSTTVATVATAPATTGIATATATATAVATGAAIANATATASTAEFYGPGLLHMTLKGNASMICSKPQRC